MTVKDPIEAIRLRCLDCCAGYSNEVDLCPVKNCSLWWFRFGTNPFVDGTYEKHRTVEKEHAKQIRAEERAKAREAKKAAKKEAKIIAKREANIDKLMTKPGKITVNKDGKGIRIDRSELRTYLNAGWEIGPARKD